MTVNIAFNGTTRSLTAWAFATGLDRTTIAHRLLAGLSVADALDPKDNRGLHMRGRRRPEWVKKKIAHGVKRASVKRPREGLGGSITFVPLSDFHDYLATHQGLADSLLYADPLELLCAAEEEEHDQ